MTTQSWQLSALAAAGWTCATWTNVSSASSSRQIIVVARIARGLPVARIDLKSLPDFIVCLRYQNTQVRLAARAIRGSERSGISWQSWGCDYRRPASSKLASMLRVYKSLISRAALSLVVAIYGVPGIVVLGSLAPSANAQNSDDKPHKTPLPLRPDVPGVQVNHRLILKDGSYQIVRKYEVTGNRVRYVSVERGGDWEEMPEELVDWPATKKWEQKQAELAEQLSPAMQEALEIDKEEATERQLQKDRMPEVAHGLNLPNQDGVFILDEYRGTPELVEIVPSTGDLQMARQHGVRAVLPLQSQLAHVELEGPAAKVHIHVNEPTIYLSLDARDDAEQVVSHSITVDTKGASQVQHPKRGATSPKSGFAIVRVDQRKGVRIVGTVHVSATGNITQEENVIPMVAEVLPGKHWLKLKAKEPLLIGEYALVEILDSKDMNASVWDFQVNPRAELNESAIGPIDSK